MTSRGRMCNDKYCRIIESTAPLCTIYISSVCFNKMLLLTLCVRVVL